MKQQCTQQEKRLTEREFWKQSLDLLEDIRAALVSGADQAKLTALAEKIDAEKAALTKAIADNTIPEPPQAP